MIEQLWGGLCMRWSEAQFRLSTDSMLLADFCRLAPQSAVCDLGCGCGSLSLLLCGKYPLLRVTGVELQPQAAALAEENAAKIQDSERISVLYTSGSSGLNTNAKGSIQAQVLDLIGIENAAVVEDVSNKGGGNPINLEQLYRFDPDVILFAAGSIYQTAADDEAWQPLRAIEAGRYYEIPSMPYNWLSNPPSLNMLLGVWWLGNLLYPQYYAYDMVEKTQEMFRLLWNYDLTAEDARAMLANSTLKGAS